ncbi:MAG: hypothetical protein AAF411_10550 [Myxococcota bacterium]
MFRSLLFLALTATAAHVQADAPSFALAEALEAQDRERAIEVADRSMPMDACVAALLLDQRLRQVHIPADGSGALGEALVASATQALREQLPSTREAMASCARVVAEAGRLADLGPDVVRRANALAAVDPARSPQELQTALQAGTELDVSWGEIRRRLRPEEAPREGWRVLPLVFGATMVAGGLAVLGATGAPGQRIDSARVRLTATGVALGGIGALLSLDAWSVQGPSRRGRIATSLWALASIGGGVALLSADVAPRFRGMGAGLLASGAVDAAVALGGLIIGARARRISLAARGSSLSFEGCF